MSREFFMHVNNHVNRKSYDKMTSGEKKKAKPSYTVAGILEGDKFKFGVSKCSVQDNFSKDIGRKRSLEEAKNTEVFVTIPKSVLDSGQTGKYFATKAKRLIK